MNSLEKSKTCDKKLSSFILLVQGLRKLGDLLSTTSIVAVNIQPRTIIASTFTMNAVNSVIFINFIQNVL